MQRQRAELSFAAETRDAKAKQKLSALNAETTSHGLEIENVQSALDIVSNRGKESAENLRVK
jgi:hypothetical protein